MVRSLLLGRFGWCWIFLLHFTVLAQPVAAEERADRLWDFANHLYDKQDYYRASSEYQRFVFLFPNDDRTDQAKLQIGRCYRREGKGDKAFSYLIRLFNSRAEEPVGPEALLEMIEIREEQERYPRAIYWAKQFIERYPDYTELDTVYLSLAWLQIDSGRYKSAMATLERIQPKITSPSIAPAAGRRGEVSSNGRSTVRGFARFRPSLCGSARPGCLIFFTQRSFYSRSSFGL